MPSESQIDVWWKNAVLYCLDVETFLDSDGDGIGDFKGLSERVDYLAGLGVTCIWLMPFYPSNQRDDGYDVCDFYNVDPRLGDLGDFTEFVHTAKAHGIKVIVDLVVNHTSDQHPWFQAARSDRDSPYRNYYIWADEPPEHEPSIVFPGEQRSNWTYDREAGQYYFHHFYEHQPDLNPSEQAVHDEMKEIMGFWLQQGVSGFRVDAVPFLIELAGKAAEEMTPHDFLKDLRMFAGRRAGNVLLLGEVDLVPNEQVKFFGDDDELNMTLSFYVNQHLYLSLAREEADPLRKSLEVLPPIPSYCQWANFLKNHDEQNLSKLTPAEMEEVFQAFGPDKAMQLYQRGLRRRLPSMLGGDERRLRMAYSLMFSLPGTPVLFYGEEIGMAENLRVKGRLAVRTPMQWKSGPNGGFSVASPRELTRRPPNDEFGPDRVNVAQQRRDPASMLNWMERLIRRRKETGELGFGKFELLDVGQRSVFAHTCDWDGRVVVAIHNLGEEECEVDLAILSGPDVIEVAEIWGDDEYRPPKDGRAQLNGYGYRWFRVLKKGQELLL
jgi:trehalose synthase